MLLATDKNTHTHTHTHTPAHTHTQTETETERERGDPMTLWLDQATLRPDLAPRGLVNPRISRAPPLPRPSISPTSLMIQAPTTTTSWSMRSSTSCTSDPCSSGGSGSTLESGGACRKIERDWASQTERGGRYTTTAAKSKGIGEERGGGPPWRRDGVGSCLPVHGVSVLERGRRSGSREERGGEPPVARRPEGGRVRWRGRRG